MLDTRLRREPDGIAPYQAPRVEPADSGKDPAEVLRAAEEEARSRGREEGYAAGRRQAEEEGAARLKALAGSIAALDAFRMNLVRRAEQDLLRLAARIAEVIVRDRVEQGSEVALRALRAALAEIPKAETFTVHCHPSEAAALESWLRAPGGAQAAFSVRPDPSLAKGGCVVESPAGEIDVRIETQLRVIEHELLSRS